MSALEETQVLQECDNDRIDYLLPFTAPKDNSRIQQSPLLITYTKSFFSTGENEYDKNYHQTIIPADDFSTQNLRYELLQDILTEYSKKGLDDTIRLDKVYFDYYYISGELSKIKPNVVLIEFTDDPSLFIKFNLNDYTVYLDFLVTSSSEDKSVVIILYRDGECVSTIEDSLENAFNRLVPILIQK
jgi:hypothetical protein